MLSGAAGVVLGAGAGCAGVRVRVGVCVGAADVGVCRVWVGVCDGVPCVGVLSLSSVARSVWR